MSQHITPIRTYVAIFLTLMVFTAITVWVAFYDLGAMNDVAAMGIAVTKATLVILYFMNVRHSSRLTWAFIGAGFLFLIILLAFTMSDTLTRDLVNQPLPWDLQ
jgi:cytochrome c oxidase subunit 4